MAPTTKDGEQELKEISHKRRNKVKLNIEALSVGERIEITELHYWIVRQVKPLNTNFFLQLIK